MSKKTEAAAATLAADGDNAENVDKIRDILFGGQMRDYEKRFRQIEQLIDKETSRVATDLQARLEQLDGFVKQEFKALSEKLQAENKDRQQVEEESQAKLAETRKLLEQRIADVDEIHGAAAQEIRTRMHEQATELLNTIRDNHSTIETSLRDESRRLGDEKVARGDLANMLSEVALRLQREFELPDE